MRKEAYLGLGSNIGDRLGYLRRALALLGNHPRVRLCALSSVYETQPVGFVEQAAFLNMVAAIDTSLSPHELLKATRRIEHTLHRRRDIRWGPRTLDIDILLYGDLRLNDEQLSVPHPRMVERAFVLVPLYELVPDMVIPGIGETVQERMEDVEGKEGVQLCPTISLAAEFGLTGS